MTALEAVREQSGHKLKFWAEEFDGSLVSCVVLKRGGGYSVMRTDLITGARACSPSADFGNHDEVGGFMAMLEAFVPNGKHLSMRVADPQLQTGRWVACKIIGRHVDRFECDAGKLLIEVTECEA